MSKYLYTKARSSAKGGMLAAALVGLAITPSLVFAQANMPAFLQDAANRPASPAPAPAPAPAPTSAPASLPPAKPEPTPTKATQKAPARAPAPAPAAAPRQAERPVDSRTRALERLSEMDIEIETARKAGELQRAREQIGPSFQLPTYSAIYGPKGAMRAVLVSATGSQLNVGVGDRITRGVTVKSISSDGVELALLERKSQRIVALDQAASQTGGGPAGMPGAAPRVAPFVAPQGPMPSPVPFPGGTPAFAPGVPGSTG